MARYGRLLTDAQWEQIRPWLPKVPKHPRGGRPRADDRRVLRRRSASHKRCDGGPDGPNGDPTKPTRERVALQGKARLANGSLVSSRLSQVAEEAVL